MQLWDNCYKRRIKTCDKVNNITKLLEELWQPLEDGEDPIIYCNGQRYKLVEVIEDDKTEN